MHRLILNLGLLFLVLGLWAQENNTDSVSLEDYTFFSAREALKSSLSFSYFDVAPRHIFSGGRRDKYIFNTYIDPHFVVFDEHGRGLNRYRGFMIDFNPKVKARIRQDFSSPVKSPSFMPGADVYFALRHSDNLNTGESRTTAFYAGYRHHSNGQDSCALSGYSYSEDWGCIQTANAGEFRMNRTDGNFSTNLVNLGHRRILEIKAPSYLSWMTFSKRIQNEKIRIMQDFSTEIHPAGLFGVEIENDGLNSVLGVDPELIGRYPFWKLRYKLQLATLSGHYLPGLPSLNSPEFSRFTIEASYAINRINPALLNDWRWTRRLNLQIIYHRAFPRSTNSGWHLKAGYTGNDEYNVFYEDSYVYLLAGIHTGIFSKRMNSNIIAK